MPKFDDFSLDIQLNQTDDDNQLLSSSSTQRYTYNWCPPAEHQTNYNCY